MKTTDGFIGQDTPAGDSEPAGGRMASPNRNGPSATAVVSNVAGFGENLLTMAELQARLSAMELRNNVQAAKLSGILLLAGSVLAVASLPVALAGIAELLVAETALQRGYAFLLVALGAIVVAAVCVIGASLSLRKKRLGFPVSAEEFSRNLHWLRTVLRYSGRPPTSRRQ
jgi:hypothetical protein